MKNLKTYESFSAITIFGAIGISIVAIKLIQYLKEELTSYAKNSKLSKGELHGMVDEIIKGALNKDVDITDDSSEELIDELTQKIDSKEIKTLNELEKYFSEILKKKKKEYEKIK